jgi:YbgC/YbaW family acyl-CoA thioester hydrolase
MQVIEAFGWPWKRMKELGFAIFIRRIQIQYLQPAQPDDVLEIGTWASNIRRSTADRHYTIRRVSDGSLLAKSNAFSVWVDLKANRPIRIPEVLLEDFSPNIL